MGARDDGDFHQSGWFASQTAKLQAVVTDMTVAGAAVSKRCQQDAGRDSNTRMEATGSPIVSDEEHRASSFATYPLKDPLAEADIAADLAGDGQYFLEQARASTQFGPLEASDRRSAPAITCRTCGPAGRDAPTFRPAPPLDGPLTRYTLGQSPNRSAPACSEGSWLPTPRRIFVAEQS